MNRPEQKQRILIVDDMPVNLIMLIEALRADYIVNVAATGEKALELAKSSSKPDLILLDIIMPGMDGYEVCYRLKIDERTKNIPIIFITSKDELNDETKGLELGAVDYIAKPFHLPIVKARVKTHLELKHHRDLLENLVFCDGLTGIPNRRRFEEYFKMMWSYGIRDFSSLSIILMDIDHFKNYNDHYGHLAGDECLKNVAATLLSSVHRAIDLVARYGGEEFIALLPCTDASGAEIIAQKMMINIASLAIPHNYSSAGNIITLSMGITSIIPRQDILPDSIIKCADDALYKSKESGRNKITVQVDFS